MANITRTEYLEVSKCYAPSKRLLRKEQLDRFTHESELSEIWNDREITKESYKQVTPKEIWELYKKHSGHSHPCCSSNLFEHERVRLGECLCIGLGGI